MNLFCIPHAGGSASVFQKWRKYLKPEVKLIPIELAGRGKRREEDFYEDFDSAVLDIYDEIRGQTKNVPFAMYGHSMGSWIVYEVYRKLKKENQQLPNHVFFSGNVPPHLNVPDDIHMLPDDLFANEILKLGDTPKELFQVPELKNVYLPILKADYRMMGNFTFDGGITKMNCDISILSGEEDKLEEKDLNEWVGYTTRNCDIVMFKGGHFFINDSKEKVVDYINAVLF